MSFRKNMLMLWGAIAGSVAFCGVAWYVAGIAPKADPGSVDSGHTATSQKTEQPMPIHDEVQYFIHRFGEEQQRLQRQPDVAHVQAF